LRILVIEDDHHILKLIEWALTERGHEVTVAHNGIEAIDILNKTSPFNLIITDIRMPGKDGNQVAKHVKEKLQYIPVIAISACSADAEKELFVSILEKPFKTGDLIQLVDSFL
jgi:CheY-like chemotaxis protein